MKTLKLLLAAAALAVAGTAASAATTTYCPGTASTSDREFTVTTSAASTCVAWGTGNISGNPANDPFMLANPSVQLIDKSDTASPTWLTVTGTGTLSGTFNIVLPAAPAGMVWGALYLGFKSGEGVLNPDWAVFQLASGVLSGDWAIASGRQSLSHANLYGTLVPAPVPLPAAGLLLLGGLGGLAALRRRKQSA